MVTADSKSSNLFFIKISECSIDDSIALPHVFVITLADSSAPHGTLSEGRLGICNNIIKMTDLNYNENKIIRIRTTRA